MTTAKKLKIVNPETTKTSRSDDSRIFLVPFCFFKFSLASLPLNLNKHKQ